MKTIALVLTTFALTLTLTTTSAHASGSYRLDWYVTEVLKSRAPIDQLDDVALALENAATYPTAENIRAVKRATHMTKLVMRRFRSGLAFGGVKELEAGSYGNATVIIASLSGYSILCDEVLGGSSDKSEFVSEAGIIHSLRDKLVKTEYGRLAAHARE